MIGSREIINTDMDWECGKEKLRFKKYEIGIKLNEEKVGLIRNYELGFRI